MSKSTSDSWFVRRNGAVAGPFRSNQLRQLARDGKLGPAMEVAPTKDGPWVLAGRVKGLFAQAEVRDRSVSSSPPERGGSKPNAGVEETASTLAGSTLPGFAKKIPTDGFSRFYAATLIGYGVALAVLHLIVSKVGFFVPYLVFAIPPLVLLGALGCVHPVFINALYSRKGTPWWAYLLSFVVMIASAAVGVWFVVLAKTGQL